MDVVLGREVDMGGSRGGFVEAVAVDMGGGMMMEGEEEGVEMLASDGRGRRTCDSSPEWQMWVSCVGRMLMQSVELVGGRWDVARGEPGGGRGRLEVGEGGGKGRWCCGGGGDEDRLVEGEVEWEVGVWWRSGRIGGGGWGWDVVRVWERAKGGDGWGRFGSAVKGDGMMGEVSCPSCGAAVDV